jgi:beta-glucosidase
MMTDTPKYKDQELPIEDRITNLLSQMTLEEKFWQLFMIPGDLSDGKENYKNGIFGFQVDAKGNSANEAEQILEYSEGASAEDTAKLINEIQRFFVEETRLGIPIIPFDEVLHGLIRKDATAFPQAIGLAATWNPDLLREVSTAIALETKSRGIRQVLSPVVNIARDVRWGRTEETYGEDPYLSTQMGTAFIDSFEKRGIITTPKHFAVNVGDGGRDSYPIHFNDRLLEEIYYPAFKACFQKAGARSVMTAYNSLDGRQCTANNRLLNDKLKNEWGFVGFVITDAGAVGGASVLHNTALNYDDATADALNSGLDVIFQTSYNHYPLFIKAFKEGLISEEVINASVRRVLKAKFELGLFENPYVDPDKAREYNACAAHRELAGKAARESIVLLKNENSTLPLGKTISSLAVIGADAIEARLGGYSGPGNNPVSILDGIMNKVGDTCEVRYTLGSTRLCDDFVSIPSDSLSHLENNQMRTGLKGEYFNSIKPEGNPDLVRTDENIDFGWTLFSPDPEKINYNLFSARWTGFLKPSQSGTFRIGIEGEDGYRLYLDEELIIDNWSKQTHQRIVKPYHFEKDKEVKIRLEFFESVGNVRFKLIWDMEVENEWQQDIADAVEIAQECDAAVIVVGIEEGEFRDRAMLSLPGHQEELIARVADTGKPVIVILIGGSAVTMESWRNSVAAIIEAWYPGDEGGNAVADILFGDYNPAGRLPITFPIHEAQLPLYYNHKPTGRGDNYNNLTGKPLFPFGYGLSFTEFEYSNLQFEKKIISSAETVTVSCNVTNIGEFDGDEVVQLYVTDILATVARPVRELKGFQRIHLRKGETKQVKFEITPEMLSMLDVNLKTVIEPGDFRITIGASSNDIRLSGILSVK